VEVFSGRLDGIALKTMLAENLPAVRADGALLRSVVVNLIDNAAEALGTLHSGNPGLYQAHSDAETVEICVSDTGTGISPEDKDKLFLPHFSTKDRGTGLGLAIAAASWLSMAAASTSKTIFRSVPVPRRASRRGIDACVRGRPQWIGRYSMTSGPHLLVVDDEAGIRESLSSILQDEGYHVEAVDPPKKLWNARPPATSRSFCWTCGFREWTASKP